MGNQQIRKPKMATTGFPIPLVCLSTLPTRFLHHWVFFCFQLACNLQATFIQGPFNVCFCCACENLIVQARQQGKINGIFERRSDFRPLKWCRYLGKIVFNSLTVKVFLRHIAIEGNCLGKEGKVKSSKNIEFIV